MATTSYDSIFSLGSTRLIVPVGATNAVLVQPVTGQVSAYFYMDTGGTCEILPPAYTLLAGVGDYLPVAQSAQALASLTSLGYRLRAQQDIPVGGPAAFYLSSLGATSVINLFFGKGQGNGP